MPNDLMGTLTNDPYFAYYDGQFEESLRMLQNINADNVASYLRAKNYLAIGKLKEAEDWGDAFANQSLAQVANSQVNELTYKNYNKLMAYIAYAYMETGQFEACDALLKKWEKAEKKGLLNNWEYTRVKAKNEIFRGDPEAAIEILNKELQNYSDSGVLRVDLLTALLAAADKYDAIETEEGITEESAMVKRDMFRHQANNLMRDIQINPVSAKVENLKYKISETSEEFLAQNNILASKTSPSNDAQVSRDESAFDIKNRLHAVIGTYTYAHKNRVSFIEGLKTLYPVSLYRADLAKYSYERLQEAITAGKSEDITTIVDRLKKLADKNPDDQQLQKVCARAQTMNGQILEAEERAKFMSELYGFSSIYRVLQDHYWRNNQLDKAAEAEAAYFQGGFGKVSGDFLELISASSSKVSGVESRRVASAGNTQPPLP